MPLNKSKLSFPAGSLKLVKTSKPKHVRGGWEVTHTFVYKAGKLNLTSTDGHSIKFLGRIPAL